MRREKQLNILVAVLHDFRKNKNEEFICNLIHEEVIRRGIPTPEKYNNYEVAWFPALRKQTPKGTEFGDCWYSKEDLPEKRRLKIKALKKAIEILKRQIKKSKRNGKHNRN